MADACNACYLASTSPAWVAQLVVRSRIDRPCELHAEQSQEEHE